MWISKRKWNDFLANYKALKYKVLSLEEAHDVGLVGSGFGIVKQYHHSAEKVSTSNISDITLEELARLVIDRKPIVREENVKVKVEYR